MKKHKKNTVLAVLFAFISTISGEAIPTVTLFSHGIADTWKQVRLYLKSYTSHDLVYHNTYSTIHTPLFHLIILMLPISFIALIIMKLALVKKMKLPESIKHTKKP